GSPWTITAKDSVNATITGISSGISVTPNTATHYTVSAPASAIAGIGFTITVTALDAFNNTATGYGGTVNFSSLDPLASVPPTSGTLVAGTGVGTFTATLKTTGNWAITATDSVS